MITMTNHHPRPPTGALPWPKVKQRKQIRFREWKLVRPLLDNGSCLRSIADNTGHLLDVYDYKPGAETGLAQGASNMMAAAAEYGVDKPYIIAGDSNVISGRE